MIARFLVVLCALLFQPAAAASERDCPVAQGLAELECTRSSQGWIYASDADDARLLADELEQVSIAFQRHFARVPPQLAIVIVGSGDSLADSDRQQLLDQGAATVLAWPGSSAFASITHAGMQNDGPAARMLGANPKLLQTMWRNVTRHEIGHVNFNLSFWPDLIAQRGHAHARSPDWLNEMAAMLQEPDVSADHRRRMLALHLQQSAAPALPPLAEFFAMKNPARPPDDQAPPSTSGMALVYRGDGAPSKQQQASALYYAQVQGFADFLVDTAPPGAVGSLAAAIARGQSFEQWLTTSTPAHDLPPSMPALEAAWQTWLSGRRSKSGAVRNDPAAVSPTPG